MKSNFKFFVPIDSFEKAKDDNGKRIMKIKGVASTTDEDTDGEFMDPNGFQLDYFTDYGFLNWHHQVKNNPLAIVGEPTKAVIKNNQFHVEGFLYDENPLAKQIYDLGEVLQKSSKKRRLGFSIEGKALERDILNKKRVTKACITGLAITPTPKNAQTLAEIVKGEIHEDDLEFDLIKDESNGGAIFIVDVTRPTGERVTVDSDFNIKVHKSLGTDSGSALIPESVEGSTKNLQTNKKNEDEDLGKIKKSEIFSSDLVKSLVYEKILDYTDDLNSAEKVYNLIQKAVNINSKDLDMKNGQTNIEVTPEAIKKAFEILDLSKGEGEEESTEQNQENSEEKNASKEEVEKSENNEELDALVKARDSKQAEIDALNEQIKKAQKGEDEEDEDDEEKKKDDDIEEGMSKEDINKMEKTYKKDEDKDNVEKSESNDLLKSIQSTLEENNKKQDAVGVLIKGFQDTIENQNEKIGLMQEQIEALESQPMPRKSTTRVIEKSFTDQEDLGDGKTHLHIGKDKRQIIQILEDRSNLEKGEDVDMQLANAMSMLETSGTIPTAVVHRLEKEAGVVIQG